MNFVKDLWTKEDFAEFHEYQKSIKGTDENCAWEKRIINTSLECCARTSSKVKDVVRQIKKGNYLSFLDGIEIKTLFDSFCCAFLIPTIKDFDIFEKYLDKFVVTIDNWASCDTLKFDKYAKEKLLVLSDKYLKNGLPFVRRVGVNIYFDLIKEAEFLPKAFKVLDSLKDETEYYVNMCGAWLLSDCYARDNKMTQQYFKSNNTNAFIVNKAIQKCRDSYRISKEDKDILLQYKK